MLTRTCHIWWATPSMARAWHLDLLSHAERERRLTLRRPADQDRFTAACALLRLAIGRYTGQAPERVRIVRACPDCDRPHGKPVLADGALEVSLSHSGDRVVVALTGAGPVGVDVEQLDRTGHLPQMERLVFSPAEIARLPVAPDDRLVAFYTCWTRKESLLKATGEGLRAPMTALTFSDFDQPAKLLACTDRTALRSVVRDLKPGRRYLGAVTVLADAPIEFAEFCGESLLEQPAQQLAG